MVWWFNFWYTRVHTFFYKNQELFSELQCSFFPSIWATSVLIPVLIHPLSSKLQFVYVTITSHLACWRSRKFPISEGETRNFKTFPHIAHHYWTLFLKISSRLLWYMFLFLAEHNLSFTLFLICSYFLTQSELRCSYKVCSYKKGCILTKI